MTQPTPEMANVLQLPTRAAPEVGYRASLLLPDDKGYLVYSPEEHADVEVARTDRNRQHFSFNPTAQRFEVSRQGVLAIDILSMLVENPNKHPVSLFTCEGEFYDNVVTRAVEVKRGMAVFAPADESKTRLVIPTGQIYSVGGTVPPTQ